MEDLIKALEGIKERLDILIGIELTKEKTDEEKIDLLFSMDLNSKQIGKIMGISDSAVRNRKRRMKK